MAIPGWPLRLQSYDVSRRSAILQFEAIKLRKFSNVSTATMRNKTTFVEGMKALVSYVGVCSLQYRVSVVYARFGVIVEDTMSLELLREAVRRSSSLRGWQCFN